LDIIGGDGTAIGIPVKQLQQLRPIWDPPGGVRDPIIRWGRKDRCAFDMAVAVAFSGAETKALNAAREWVKQLTTTMSLYSDGMKLSNHEHLIPPIILKELKRLLLLPLDSQEREPLRKLLRATCCSDSVTGIVTPSQISTWEAALKVLRNPRRKDILREFQQYKQNLQCAGMGPEMYQVLIVQLLSTSNEPNEQTLELMDFLGE
jgi:hypothetical protein